MQTPPPSVAADNAAERQPHTACIALGSNLGDRLACLQAAIDALAAHGSTRILAISAVYKTAPVGPVPQGAYLNAAVLVATSLAPLPLLHLGLAIEQENGRVRKKRFGPRTLDIDLLAHSAAQKLDTAELILPHPRLHERAFVLCPLADVAPELVVNGKAIREWLEQCSTEGVTRTALRLVHPYPAPENPH